MWIGVILIATVLLAIGFWRDVFRGRRTAPGLRFEAREVVRVINGPFQHFQGTIESVQASKFKVLVLLYGLEQPVEFDLTELEKSAAAPQAERAMPANQVLSAGAYDPALAKPTVEDWQIEREVEERNLRGFKRKTVVDGLIRLGFSSDEIASLEHFLSNELPIERDPGWIASGRAERAEILRLSPQHLVDYVIWRLEGESFTAWSLETQRVIDRLRLLSARERRSFRELFRLLVR
jgi:hypothetical protein